MSQFAVPIETIEAQGPFTSVPSQTTANLHLNIDDDAAGEPPVHDSDSSYIEKVQPFNQDITFKFGLLGVPSDFNNVKIHVFAKRIDPITNELARLRLWQGNPVTDPSAFVVAQHDYHPSIVWLDEFYQLTPSEAGLITDWSNLYGNLTLVGDVTAGTIRITQVYIETSVAKIGGEVDSVALRFGVQEVTADFHELKIPWTPLELQFDVQDVFVGPTLLTLTPDPVVLELGIPAVTITRTLTLTPDPVVLVFNSTPVNVPRTLVPDVVVLEFDVPSTTVPLDKTPDPVVLEFDVPSVSISFTLTPDPVVLVFEVFGGVNLAPLVITPDPVVLEFGAPQADTDITPLVITPDAVVLEFEVFGGVDFAPLVITPDPVVLEFDTPSVSTSFGPRTLTPDPVVLVFDVRAMTKVVVKITPDVVILEFEVPMINVINPYFVRVTRGPARPRRLRRTIPPTSVFLSPSTFRARFRHDARGRYRVFNEAGYRFYRADGQPPIESDAPYATSATLAATPSTTFADGNWYLSVSYFNGVIDSGFLPLGANGETYLRLRLAAGVDVGEPPAGPLEWRLERRAGGVVAVLGMYFDTSNARALDWAIAWTFAGGDPAADSPNTTVTMPTSGLVMLDHELAAQADGVQVKVRLQTQRTGSTIYSQQSIVKTIAAATVGIADAAETVDRWTGRLPVDQRP